MHGDMAFIQVRHHSFRQRARSLGIGDFLRHDRLFRDEDGDTRTLRLIILMGNIENSGAHNITHVGQHVLEPLGVVFLVDIFDILLPLLRCARIVDIVDIDVSTCGRISPLKALNYLLHSFDSDIVTMDYRVRGFTRDVDGRKHYIDHEIDSIQNFIADDTKLLYQMIDVNVYQENIFHTKMRLKEPELGNYLFGVDVDELDADEQERITQQLEREMLEIYYGRNLGEEF